MTIAIRRGAAADAAVLNGIVQGSAAYGGDYAGILRGYEINAAQIARDELHLADAGEQGVLGFYSLMLGAVPELDLLFVADAAQRRGVGRLLIGHLRETARGHGIAQVRIVAHPPAAPFYRRVGAIEVGIAYPAGKATWPRPIFSLPVST